MSTETSLFLSKPSITVQDYFNKFYEERNKMNKSFGLYWNNSFIKSLTLNQKLKVLYLNSLYVGRRYYNKHNCYMKCLKSNNASGYKNIHYELMKLKRNLWISEEDLKIIKEVVQKNLRIKGIIYKFYHLLNNKLKKKPINDCTLHLEDIHTLKNSDIVHLDSNDKRKYFVFSLEVIANIISSAFLQANPHNKLKSKPVMPVNPYTRETFSIKNILTVYTRMKKYGKHIPIALEMFMKSGMNLRKFNYVHKDFLNEKCSLQYVKELDKRTLMELVIEYASYYNTRYFVRQLSYLNDFRYCIPCLKNLVNEDRDSVIRLIRDYIYYTNNKISINTWIGSEILFQRTHPYLNCGKTRFNYKVKKGFANPDTDHLLMYNHDSCNFLPIYNTSSVDRLPGTGPFDVEPDLDEDSVTEEYNDEEDDLETDEVDEDSEFSDTPQIVIDRINDMETSAEELVSETGISHRDALITVMAEEESEGSDTVILSSRLRTRSRLRLNRNILENTRGSIEVENGEISIYIDVPINEDSN